VIIRGFSFALGLENGLVPHFKKTQRGYFNLREKFLLAVPGQTFLNFTKSVMRVRNGISLHAE